MSYADCEEFKLTCLAIEEPPEIPDPDLAKMRYMEPNLDLMVTSDVIVIHESGTTTIIQRGNTNGRQRITTL